MTVPLIRSNQAPRREATRRLLLISPGFPPSNEVGGLRWQKMLRTLEQAGWVADVLTVMPPSERQTDLKRLDDLPDSTRVYALPPECMHDATTQGALAFANRVRMLLRNRAPGRETAPSGSASVSGTGAAQARPAPSGWRSRILLGVHLRHQRAAAAAMARGAQALLRERPHVLVSSGPPHSAHLAARVVARSANLPWVMDWRDPWTFDEFLGSFDADQYTKAELPLERACLHEATAVVVNSAPVQHELQRRYPALSQRIATIPNGADAEALPEWSPSARMRIVYAGALFPGRDPRLFMRGVAEAINVHRVPANEVVLQFVTGTPEYEGRPLADLARELGVVHQVEVHSFMPRHALLEWLAGTAVNVLVQVPSTYQVPAKLFEYMQMPAWLVAVTNAPNAISHMLEGSSAIVVPPDPVELGQTFADLFRRRAAGERPVPVNDGRYDRARRAEEMLAVLERACHSAATPAAR